MGKTASKVNREREKREKAHFRSELKKAFVTAIIAAFGFLTAFAWRDVASELVDKIETISPVQGKIITALIVTILSAFIVYLTVRIPSNKS